MKKPKVRFVRIHQENGPDYFEAHCYFQEYSLITREMTKQKALDKMFDRLDKILYADWYTAHRWNAYANEIAEREKLHQEVMDRIRNPEPKKPKGAMWRKLMDILNNQIK